MARRHRPADPSPPLAPSDRIVGASLVACGSGNGEKLGERVIPLGPAGAEGRRTVRHRRRLPGGWRLVSAAGGSDLRPRRHGVLVWRAVSWPPHRQWRDLRHGPAVGRLADLAHAGLCAGDQSREPPVDHRPRQRSRSLPVRPHHRSVAAIGRGCSAFAAGARRRCAFNISLARRSMATTATSDAIWQAKAGRNSPRRGGRRCRVWWEALPRARRRRRRDSCLWLASGGAPVPRQAAPGRAPQLRWQASTRVPAGRSPRERLGGGGRFLIQAGSFRSEDNAERARSLLGGIAAGRGGAGRGRRRDSVSRSGWAVRGRNRGLGGARPGDRGGLSRRENRYELEFMLSRVAFSGRALDSWAPRPVGWPAPGQSIRRVKNRARIAP